MDRHIEQLQSVCRVGGSRFSSHARTTRHEVQKYVDPLKKVYGIDVTSDQVDTQPPYLCSICERVLSRGTEHCGGGCGTVVKWKPHNKSECSFCTSEKHKSKGGRPAKRKCQAHLRGQAAKWTATAHSPSASRDATTQASNSLSAPQLEDIMPIATPSYKANEPLKRERFVDNNFD